MGDNDPMLRRLIFNLGGVIPEIAGGVANVCQAFVNRIPDYLPEVEVWALTGTGDWQHRYPLTGRARVFSIEHLNSLRAGNAFERAAESPGLELGLKLRYRLGKLRGNPSHQFPARWSRDTVVHCPYQVTHPMPPAAWNLPYVINLHDIQHEHFPEFFTPEELTRRRASYLASARHAAAVCVVDEWTRRDVLSHLPIPESKVFVAPLGPLLPPMGPSDEGLAWDLLAGYGFSKPFAFYPAQTWPHKNHERLIQAVASLKQEQGIRVDLVCTGHLTDNHPRLVLVAKHLGIADQVHFLGLVPTAHVHALYRTARMVVIPTLFEGGPGIPVLESLAMGLPLAASRVCGIPDAVGDAGVLFDPLNVAEMASAISYLWTNTEARRKSSERALVNGRAWTWEQTARRYASIYQEVLAQCNARRERQT